MKILTLDEKISKRKVKKPNFLFYNLLKLAAYFTKLQHNFSLDIVDPLPKKGPAILMFSHGTRFDYMFAALAAKHRRVNFVAAYNEHFKSSTKLVLKLCHTIPKKNFAFEIEPLAKVKKILEMGGIVSLSPEGRTSDYGERHPVVAGTGIVFKRLNVPIYLINIKGDYLASPLYCNDIRKGKIIGTLTKLDLEKVEDNKLDDYINEQMKCDDFEWQKEKKIKWKFKKGCATRIEKILYKCPKCGKEFLMESKGDTLICSNCGNGVKIDNYYNLTPIDNNSKTFSTPSKWANYERKCIIDEIRENPNYEWKLDVKIGMLPTYKYLKNGKSDEIVGSGYFIVNHKGVKLEGDKYGEPFSIFMGYSEIVTLLIANKIDSAFFYYNDTYYSIYLDTSYILKLCMLIEEMHRLHLNKYKNFTWYQNLYCQN